MSDLRLLVCKIQCHVIRRSRAAGFKSLLDTNPLGTMRCRQSCDLPGRGAPIADSLRVAQRLVGVAFGAQISRFRVLLGIDPTQSEVNTPHQDVAVCRRSSAGPSWSWTAATPSMYRTASMMSLSGLAGSRPGRTAWRCRLGR